MFDLGWSEMALILLVALIVIGPKDLPRVARTIGKWTAKARAMAREFQRSLDDMAREAELQDIKAEMEKLNRTDVRREIETAVDPDGSLRRGLAPPGEAEKPASAASPAAPTPPAAEAAAPPAPKVEAAPTAPAAPPAEKG